MAPCCHEFVVYELVAPWRKGYNYCAISLKEAWTQALRRFKSYSQRSGDLWWLEFLTMFPARNKAKRHSSVNN